MAANVDDDGGAAAGAPLSGAVRGIVDGIMRSHRGVGGPVGVVEHVEAFAAAVDWTEPFVASLLAFHAAAWLAAYLGRRSVGVRAALLCLAMAVVAAGERLNGLGSRRWREFARQDYFDPGGVFFTLLVSVPLALLSFAILVHGVCAASSLLVEVKRLELRKKSRARRDEAAGTRAGRNKKKRQ